MLDNLKEAVAGPSETKNKPDADKSTRDFTTDSTVNLIENSKGGSTENSTKFLTINSTDGLTVTVAGETRGEAINGSSDSTEGHLVDETTFKKNDNIVSATTDRNKPDNTELTADILSDDPQNIKDEEYPVDKRAGEVVFPQVRSNYEQVTQQQHKKKKTVQKNKGQKEATTVFEEKTVNFIDIGEIKEEQKDQLLVLLQGAVQKWSEDDSFIPNRKEYLVTRRLFVYPAEEKFFDQLCEETGIPRFRLANAALDFFFHLLATNQPVPKVEFNRKQHDSGRLSRLGISKVQKISDGEIMNIEIHKAFAKNIDDLCTKIKTKKSIVFNWVLNSIIALLFDEKELREFT